MFVCYRSLVSGNCIFSFVIIIKISIVLNRSIATVKFLHSVGNLVSDILVSFQITPCVLPTVSRIQLNYFSFHYTILKQSNIHTCRPNTVLIIIIIPGFFDFDTGFLCLMCVRDCNFIVLNCIGDLIISIQITTFCNSRITVKFLNSIDNLRSIISILIQIVPYVFPTIACIQRHSWIHCNIVLIQLYCNVDRTHAILIIIVVPSLLNFNTCLLRCMSICDRMLVVLHRIGYLVVRIQIVTFCNGSIITIKFLNSIGNLSSVILILIKIAPCFFPAVRRTQRNNRSLRHTVFIQLDVHTRQTNTIPVVIVFPGLFNLNVRLFRYMCIRNCYRIFIRSIAGRIIIIKLSAISYCCCAIKLFYIINN